MPGEVYAIACAFLWALSSTLVKSQTHKMHVVLLGALRTVPALLLYWSLLILTDRTAELSRLPFRAWALLISSTVVGLALGDQLYFQSMKLIGLSRAMPLSTTYPFFTLLLALLFLDEQIGWAVVGGAVLIVSGAYLLAFPRGATKPRKSPGVQEVDLGGVALALVAALCWGASTVMLRLGLEEVDVVIANAVRLSVLAVVLFAMTLRHNELGRVREYVQGDGLRSLAVIFLAGFIGMGLGTFAFLAAVQRAGAARTSVLTAMTPLFGVPFSLILKEKLSGRTVLGTVLTVAGVWLTIY